MKRLFTVVVLLTLCLAVTGFGQAKKWQFLKVFPDTSMSYPSGVHGLAVDPLGRLWVQPYSATDSVPRAGGGFVKTRAIIVYNPNGTEAAISRIKTVTVGGKTDTLIQANVGMNADAEGNIAFASREVAYKVDYKTGQGLLKVTPDTAGTLSQLALVCPVFTAANEMFTGHVFAGNPIKLFNPDFTPSGIAVASSRGFSRTMAVSPDGNNIYWPGYSLDLVLVYNSPLGTLGTYTQVDSFMIGAAVESMQWHPKNHYLYASGGNIDTTDYGAPSTQWRPNVWYGLDMANKYAVKDSIEWNWAAYPYSVGSGGTLAPRPRAMAFSPSGDTAYVACFNHSKAAIQMFVLKATAVEQVDNTVPATYTLSQNYPNPFNPTTEIQFSVPKGGFVTLKVYDLLGREVATLVNENLAPGNFKARFDAGKLSTGTYVYRLATETTQITKKMMLVK